MKLATYNIHKGGRQRVHWTTLLECHGVDLLLVQESYPVDQHLPPLFYSAGSGQSVWEMVEQNGWGSAVMSRWIGDPGDCPWFLRMGSWSGDYGSFLADQHVRSTS